MHPIADPLYGSKTKYIKAPTGPQRERIFYGQDNKKISLEPDEAGLEQIYPIGSSTQPGDIPKGTLAGIIIVC